MCYSVQSRDRIFVKGYEFQSFTKNVGSNIGKSISENLSGKYSQKRLDVAKQSATDAFNTASKIAIQKTAEANGDLIGNKIANKITNVSKNSQQNNSGTVKNETFKEILRERYVPPEERQKIINEMRLINLLNNTPNHPTKFRTK